MSAGTGSLPTRIVVGTDGSDTAAIAVREARDLALATGAALEIVTVAPAAEPAGPAEAYDPTVEEDEATRDLPGDVPRPVGERAGASAILEAAAAEAAAAGVTEIATHGLEGDPAEAILDFAERTDADLIVVGNKGMTGARRLMLGSVPNKITHHAPCSVWVVRTT